jgi:hypothetical protein
MSKSWYPAWISNKNKATTTPALQSNTLLTLCADTAAPGSKAKTKATKDAATDTISINPQA